MEDIICLELINWTKFQKGRKDVTHPSWFKLKNSIFEHEEFWSLTREELCFFFYIMCLASKQNSSIIKINILKAVNVGQFKRAAINSSLKKLESMNTIKITSNVDVTSTARERNEHGTLEENREEENREEENRDATAGESPVIAEFPTISQKLFNSWSQTYQDKAWIDLEIKKAQAWIHANPRKAPKTDFARFLNNWLSRGWENYRKTLKSERKNTWLENYEAEIKKGEIVNGP